MRIDIFETTNGRQESPCKLALHGNRRRGVRRRRTDNQPDDSESNCSDRTLHVGRTLRWSCRVVCDVASARCTLIVCGETESSGHSRRDSRPRCVGNHPRVGHDAAMTAELAVEDIVVGDGAEASTGNQVDVHYTGWLTNGDKFDSSLDRGRPFSFELGARNVIAGWDQGVVGMRVGGKRKLTIPPDLGYGDRGAGAVIPPGATLVFEVELLAIK